MKEISENNPYHSKFIEVFKDKNRDSLNKFTELHESYIKNFKKNADDIYPKTFHKDYFEYYVTEFNYDDFRNIRPELSETSTEDLIKKK